MNTEIVKKKVTLYNTVGQNKKVIDSEASCWKELKAELSDLNISFNNMRVIVGGSNVTLESPNAILPETDFLLFLFPVKVKSGNNFEEYDENEAAEINNSGAAHNFDYANDNIEDYFFTNSKEEIKVRLQLIVNGSEKNKEHAGKVMQLIDATDLLALSPADPAMRKLAEEAARIAESLDD
jgi:hypothetical protein